MTDMCCNSHSPFVQTTAQALHHEAASSRYFWLRMHCPEIARRAKPGQFVMLACAEDAAGYAEPLLPRPLAILDATGDEIELLYFVSGRGTQSLKRVVESSLASGANRGAKLRVIGPLGRGFEPLPNVDAHVALGGGSGVAPLVYFFRKFAEKSAGDWHLILAARSAEQLVRPEIVATPGKTHRATDDGSAGFKGTAVGALESLLENELKGRRVGIYAAGPEPMMIAAAKAARRLNLPACVSLEARMACGVGVCRACIVDGVSPHGKTRLLRRTVCQDGPVFNIDELAGW